MSYNARSIRSIAAAAAGVILTVSLLTASLPAAHAEQGPALGTPQAAGTNFNTSFNWDHANWSVVTGPWWQGPTTAWTKGIAGKLSSIRHSGTYSKFVYSARLKRTGCTSCANILWVRATPGPLNPTDNAWNKGYAFWYYADGRYGVFRLDGGVVFPLTGVISSAAIIQGANWNVLKVVFYGPVWMFIINGVPLYATYEYTYSNGYVGIGMYTDVTTGNKLSVDWAKLNKIVGDPGPLLGVDVSAPGTPAPLPEGVDPWNLP